MERAAKAPARVDVVRALARPRAAAPSLTSVQQAAGNLAIQRKASAPASAAGGLAIGRVDDPLEHEADRMADHVMTGSASRFTVAASVPQLRRKCTACTDGATKCEACEE